MEMELKLLLDPAARSMVESHPAFATARRKERSHEVTTYFDTPDLRLQAQGASLRVRQRGQSFVQTVKVARNDDAFGMRSEWEWPVASAHVDAAALASLPKSLAGVSASAQMLEPVFASEIDRDTWLIRLDGDTEVEAVIDEGAIRAGPRSTPVCEVELELKGGPVAPLFRLAIELVERAGLRYGARSKAQRGYDLHHDDPAAELELPADALESGTTLARAFPRLVAAALREMAADIAPAARGDVEGVHRMRAAIRKLRTVLVLFGPHIDREASARFNATLRELGGVLGRRRDWDVFLTETLEGARHDLASAGVDLLSAPAQEQRGLAQAEVATTLDGPVPTRLILGLAAWTAGPDWAKTDLSDAPLQDALPDLLDRLARKVRKRAKHIDSLDAEELHALRKAMKKLRYSAEGIAPLYPPKTTHRYVKAVKAALGLLGEINDASVTRARVDEIAGPDRPELGGPAAALLALTTARRAEALKSLSRKLQAFEKIEPFWS